MNQNKMWLLFQIYGDDQNSELICFVDGNTPHTELLEKVKAIVKKADEDNDYVVKSSISPNADLSTTNYFGVSVYTKEDYDDLILFGSKVRRGIESIHPSRFAWQLNSIGEVINEIYLPD